MTTTEIDRPQHFQPVPVGTHATQATQVEQARAIAEVQAAVVVAQQCPRDMTRAEGEMRDSCGRLALAQRAFYRVPNRGQGSSVHLARELARVWGNVQYGVHELRRDDHAGMSEIQAFAWDVQTNTRSTRTFQVPHQRMVKGERKALDDLGDVYLNNQNIGARAVRECIFTVLPTWLVEAAEDICRTTLQNGDGKPLKTRIEEAVKAFHDQHGIKAAQLEDKLGRKRGQWDAGDVAALQVLYMSLQRGEISLDEEFAQSRVTASDFEAAAAPADAMPEPAHVEPEPEPASDGSAQFGSHPADSSEAMVAMAATTRKHMFALLTKRGITDRDEQIAGMVHIIGRPIESRSELTEAEGQQIITQLEAQA